MHGHHHHHRHDRWGGGGHRHWSFSRPDWEHSAGRGRGRGRGRGHGGRARRMFDGTELRLLLLKLIADSPRHGYDLIREIEERTGGAYAPSPGVIYPTLTLLGEMGLIEEQQTEGAKKVYAATAAGHAHLAERVEEVEALLKRLVELGSQRARAGGGAPIRRAMANLKTALRERLDAEEGEPETVHEIAAILDEAARKIERLP